MLEQIIVKLSWGILIGVGALVAFIIKLSIEEQKRRNLEALKKEMKKNHGH